ncbi:MAG: hypothetical protein C5B50_20660 [Verrucomicrobia bacterium]|nr:MAG: hypothetical protein C5B50_20660 [Verrucomicrobiota bacterium]
MGQMTLQVEGRANGQAYFRVEEYKRPKFQVTLDAPKTAAKLNEKVVLTGHAMAYTGAAVDGAPVKYRVVREVRMPWWWGWWGRGIPMRSESQEIAHGTAATGTDGTFKIEFTAKPDRKVPEKDEPTFIFQITTDVTDSAGETRSGERDIRVGYTALEAKMTTDDWQTDAKPVEVKVETKTLDEEPQQAKGSLKIYALKAPATVQRAPLGGPSPMPLITGDETSDRSDRSDRSDPNNWPLGNLLAEKTFSTDTNGLDRLSFKLAPGAYRALLETQDRFGKKVTGKLPIRVLRPADSKLAIKIPHLLAAPDWEVQPGEEFMALWGTGYAQGRAFIEIEHRNKIIERYWTKPGRTQQQIKLPVTEDLRGGFTLHVTQVRENRGYLESHKVEVPWKNKDLELTWEHFVSKLQPGQRETWTLKIRSPKSEARTGESKGQSSKSGAPNSASARREVPKRKIRAETEFGAPKEDLEGVVAELVAALYDESLDAFAPHQWLNHFGVFYQDGSSARTLFANSEEEFQHVLGSWRDRGYENVSMSYRHFPSRLVQEFYVSSRFHNRLGLRGGAPGRTLLDDSLASLSEERVLGKAMPMASAALADAAKFGVERKPALTVDLPEALAFKAEAPPGGAASRPDLGQVTARKNLNETAFFYPQLTSDSNGVVGITFTMPEALTKWRFLAFAHDRSLRAGFLEDHAVTAKDLMVQPNPPRFLREGDTVEFTVKVSNQSEKSQTGSVRINFNDALTGKPMEAALSVIEVSRLDQPAKAGTTNTDQSFTIQAKESRSFAWRITVPDGCGFLTYKAVGAAPGVSDGEEGAIPVLSRRIFVTESLPLPIRGPATKKFEFTKLLKSGQSDTLRNENLVVQMVSNPAWYAVLALPYLMEFPHECSEQVFNRLYANALARSIAKSDPKIHRVFEQWRNTTALESPLEKNQDLKSLALEESPWVRQAQSETQARKNVGILFDDNRLDYETDRARQKLAEMQLPDGSWPWFPGDQGNDYITLYITTGFGRLRHLGVETDMGAALRSLQRLDAWMNDEFDRIQKQKHPEEYVPSSTDALYLYGRSFFLKDRPIAAPHQKALAFFLGQSRKFWLKTSCRQTQGHIALALSRFNSFNSFNDSTPNDIMLSLKERSVSDEEMGMFWRDTEYSWWWYRAPIETQALMIEAFDEIVHDAQAVEDCKVWLLKQKQTQDWKTTKATADAVYALLLKGKDLLSSDALVEVKLDGIDVTPNRSADSLSARPEAGTGFYEHRFPVHEIKPELGEITVKKVDEGVAWGSVHWQYLEDMSKVTPYEGTPLKLKKTLFTKTNTNRGPVIEAVKGPLAVGDELVVRIELRVDRDMEYVHLKDQRGSGTEPVNVVSHYKYQDGLGYYESTRDTASHFFISYLPKGVYVFEYSTRIQLRGQYQTGIAEIQCMYAPEFNSHSESIPLVVK